MSYGTPDLNFVESDIDLTTVKPIGVGEIVRLVNEYLLRMTDILNAFAVRTEGGIVQLDRRLDSVESQIILLEKKLENVKLTESIQSGPIMSHHITQLHQDAPQELASTSAENITVSEEIRHSEDPQKIIEAGKESTNDEKIGLLKIKDHPSYVKYFKMLKMGVPEPAVMQKMSAEGLNPSILQKPDEMVPDPSAHVSNKKDDQSSTESEKEFSDSD